MNLIESLSQKSKILELVEQNDGELDDITEMDLTLIERDVCENIDNISRYWCELQRQIDEQPRQVRAFASHLSDKLNTKKEKVINFLRPVLKMNGKLKTEFSSINLVSKKIRSVVIDDFDLVCKCYPECISITDAKDKSERVIRILKSEILKSTKYHESVGADIKGWHYEDGRSEYILCKHLSP